MKTFKLISIFICFSSTVLGQIDKKELWKLHRQQSIRKSDSIEIYHLTNGNVNSNFGDFTKNDTLYYANHDILRTYEAKNGYLNGNLVYYFLNGKIAIKSKLKDNEYCDTSIYYNKQGAVTMLTVYLDTKNRIVTGYYNSGEIKNIQKIHLIEEKNDQDSLVIPKLKSTVESDLYFDKKGKEISLNEYLAILKNDYLNNPGPQNVPSNMIMPTFIGGESEMTYFIKKNIKYPKSEKRKEISGTCIVSFVVEKDGKITEVKLQQGIENGPKCNAEALRVVQLMPNWVSGKMDGQAIRVQYNLPIKFNIRN